MVAHIARFNRYSKQFEPRNEPRNGHNCATFFKWHNSLHSFILSFVHVSLPDYVLLCSSRFTCPMYENLLATVETTCLSFFLELRPDRLK
jgi:hypothetical protein